MSFNADMCKDHAKRLRLVEEKAAVAEYVSRDVARIETSVDKLETSASELKSTVVGLSAQTKVTWILLFAVFTALIGMAVAIVQSGVLARIP
jgi:hypothetical protein